MSHAAKEVTIVRKKIKGLSRNLEKKSFLHILPPRTLEKDRRGKHPHRNKIVSNKNFKIKLDIFLRKPILL